MSRKFLALISFALCAQFANASVISNSFSGLASPSLTITFDEHVLPGSSTVTNQYSDLGVVFSPNLYYSSQSGFPNISGNTVTNFGNGSDVFQFSLNFLTSQTGAAFAMVSNTTSWNFEALLGNSVVESFAATVDTSASDFFGFTGISFDQIRITSAVNDYMIIDNLQISNAANVPEPASLALLGMGLAGLAASRRRQKTNI